MIGKAKLRFFFLSHKLFLPCSFTENLPSAGTNSSYCINTLVQFTSSKFHLPFEVHLHWISLPEYLRFHELSLSQQTYPSLVLKLNFSPFGGNWGLWWSAFVCIAIYLEWKLYKLNMTYLDVDGGRLTKQEADVHGTRLGSREREKTGALKNWHSCTVRYDVSSWLFIIAPKFDIAYIFLGCPYIT